MSNDQPTVHGTDADEPARPQRGFTHEERGRDVSDAQARAEQETSVGRGLLRAIRPGFLLSQAEGYPIGVKQFLQFCLLLIYPAWVFAALICAAVYYPVYGLLWALFWPIRNWMKRNRPEEYAASQQK